MIAIARLYLGTMLKSGAMLTRLKLKLGLLLDSEMNYLLDD